MTDARLRGEWLGKLKFDNLSDAAWRVFTSGLMWSAEQGTDGRIPRRYLRALHPDGDNQDAVKEIAQAGIWEVDADGAHFIDWDGALGQSTALQVETQKANARERQRAHRERERAKLAKSIGFTDTTSQALGDLPGTGYVTGDVTRDTTGPATRDVGKGTGTGKGSGKPSSGSSISEPESVAEISVDPSTEAVTGWPVAPIPGGNDSCRICGQKVSGGLDAWGLCSKISAPHVEARRQPVGSAA